jgi:hypothetical protein
MAKVRTKFENQDWKLEIEDAKPKGAVSPGFIAPRFAICALPFDLFSAFACGFAFCALPFAFRLAL